MTGMTCLFSLSAAAGQLPSVFRGVVVADSPLGVRVVRVEAASQAYLADLRPEDIIVRVDDTEVHTIDEFAALSASLKGRVRSARILMFRNGVPRELVIHLYSYPILRSWGVEFIPDHDIRFAEARVGLEYWSRMGRGFEGAGKLREARDAYLNGLHNVPGDTATALKIAEVSSTLSQQRLTDGSLADGVTLLQQAIAILEKLFERPLSPEQLMRIRRELEETLQALRHLKARQTSGMVILSWSHNLRRAACGSPCNTTVRLDT